MQPRASRNEIAGVIGTEIKVRITAPPVDSAANEELLRFLAKVLDIPKSRVELVRGGASRHKIIRVMGLHIDDVAERLERES